MIMINHHFPDSRPRPQKCYEEAPHSFVLKSCSSLPKGTWVRKKRGVASHKFVNTFLEILIQNFLSVCSSLRDKLLMKLRGCRCKNLIEGYETISKLWILDCFSIYIKAINSEIDQFIFLGNFEKDASHFIFIDPLCFPFVNDIEGQSKSLMDFLKKRVW